MRKAVSAEVSVCVWGMYKQRGVLDIDCVFASEPTYDSSDAGLIQLSAFARALEKNMTLQGLQMEFDIHSNDEYYIYETVESLCKLNRKVFPFFINFSSPASLPSVFSHAACADG